MPSLTKLHFDKYAFLHQILVFS